MIQVFHEPFAWFGSRTVLGDGPRARRGGRARPGRRRRLPEPPFFPTGPLLADGMPLILDLAPVVRGITSDIGYSCGSGSNAMFDELDRGLAHIRTFLLDGIRSGETMLSLYGALDDLMRRAGLAELPPALPRPRPGHMSSRSGHDPVRPFAPPRLRRGRRRGPAGRRARGARDGACYPVWNDSSFTDYRPRRPVGRRAAHRARRRRRQVRGAPRRDGRRCLLARRPSAPHPSLGGRRLQHRVVPAA